MTYRAVFCRQLGTPDVLQIELTGEPPLGANDVRLRIAAAGVNFPDLLMVAGEYQLARPWCSRSSARLLRQAVPARSACLPARRRVARTAPSAARGDL